ncbi:L,D-transpeptidase family protein [Aurantimonas sp. DM33-3]|uniref:L,D-transpeptidase family protein n=1 Tax=Aurantimonas sp. DM33-3 TaxID=2766955 RepID=UPI001651BADC|nr:L,D-transpeptidase family protein [Aurantimonas sp. DM33-3]MBC6716577.1 L,D-transpeptidase family protein [Aurantimonas sp. DM33-3]
MITRRGFVIGAGAAASLAPARASQASGWVGGFDIGNATMGTHFTNDPLLSEASVASTRRAADAYRDLAAQGGWPQADWISAFKLGSRHPQIAQLRRRLTMENDLNQAYASGDVFDSFVDAAVRRFQVRHGLAVDGAVGPETLAAMNEPAGSKARQLELNIPRIASELATEARYICVNIPSAELELVEEESVVERHPTIVGRPDRETPLLTSAIYEVNFNPYWTVPASIVRKDLIPAIRSDPTYLERMSMRIFDHDWDEVSPTSIDWNGDEALNYIFRQDPGADNALGRVRINFANDHAVYLHDTPQPGLFGDASRFHSSGCIRVQRIPEFVAWLLRETPGWSLTQVRAMLTNGQRKDVRLAREIPVHFVYITAWSAPDLTSNFRDDVYGLLSKA